MSSAEPTTENDGSCLYGQLVQVLDSGDPDKIIPPKQAKTASVGTLRQLLRAHHDHNPKVRNTPLCSQERLERLFRGVINKLEQERPKFKRGRKRHDGNGDKVVESVQIGVDAKNHYVLDKYLGPLDRAYVDGLPQAEVSAAPIVQAAAQGHKQRTLSDTLTPPNEHEHEAGLQAPPNAPNEHEVEPEHEQKAPLSPGSGHTVESEPEQPKVGDHHQAAHGEERASGSPAQGQLIPDLYDRTRNLGERDEWLDSPWVSDDEYEVQELEVLHVLGSTRSETFEDDSLDPNDIRMLLFRNTPFQPF